MTSVIFDDGFYATAKAGTSIDNSFRGIIGPLLDNGSLQRIYIRVTSSIGLPLNGTLPEKVKWIQIRAWWEPNIFFPKFDHIVFAKIQVFYRNMEFRLLTVSRIDLPLISCHTFSACLNNVSLVLMQFILIQSLPILWILQQNN